MASLQLVVTVVMLYAGYLSLFIAHLVGQIVSEVWVSASFHIITRRWNTLLIVLEVLGLSRH